MISKVNLKHGTNFRLVVFLMASQDPSLSCRHAGVALEAEGETKASYIRSCLNCTHKPEDIARLRQTVMNQHPELSSVVDSFPSVWTSSELEAFMNRDEVPLKVVKWMILAPWVSNSENPYK